MSFKGSLIAAFQSAGEHPSLLPKGCGSIGSGLRALVLSPFLTAPLDAGQRKRAFQTTSLLRSWGYEIVFLHYAIETPWGWAHHEGAASQAVKQWDEVITFYGGPEVSRPPKNGRIHQLDEWFDDALGTYLKRLFHRRWFDVLVVHNVWLSKCFDYVPPGCVRILEMHDVFSDRLTAYEKIGVPPDFFSVSFGEEVFGIDRSDIAIAIKEEEAERVRPHLGRAAVCSLPYTEPAVPAVAATEYRHSAKVTFGFMGSAHPFNAVGISSLVRFLEEEVKETLAPVELIVAGEVGKVFQGRESGLVRTISYVEDVREFYERVDFCVSPLDAGSGVKIKVGEAIAYGVPMLSTAHSAEGCFLDPRLVVPDIPALARLMVEIAMKRPPLSVYARAVTRSRMLLEKSLTKAQNCLNALLSIRQFATVVSMPELELPETDPRFWAASVTVRQLSNLGPVFLDLGDYESIPKWLRVMPAQVRLIYPECGERRTVSDLSSSAPRSLMAREHLDDPGKKVVVWSSDPGYSSIRGSVRVLDARFRAMPADGRWDYLVLPPGGTEEPSAAVDVKTITVPYFADSIKWQPEVKSSPQTALQSYAILMTGEPADKDPAIQALILWMGFVLRKRYGVSLIVFRPSEEHIGSELVLDLVPRMKTQPVRWVFALNAKGREFELVRECCAELGVPVEPLYGASSFEDAVRRKPGETKSSWDGGTSRMLSRLLSDA